MAEKKPKLVSFDSMADIPCYYARVNAAYGDLSKTTKTRKRKLHPSFLKKMDACMQELWWITSAIYGGIEALVSGGAYVKKAGWHGKGKAYDLGGIHWQEGPVLTTLEVAENFHDEILELDLSNYLLYMGCESVLRRHFGTVLGIHYNKQHWNHWHIDPGSKVGYWGKGFGSSTRVTFLQEVLKHVWDVDAGITDGKEGAKTRRAIKEVREKLSLEKPLTDQTTWLQFLLLTAMVAIQS
jgi:hypothetical protein